MIATHRDHRRSLFPASIVALLSSALILPLALEGCRSAEVPTRTMIPEVDAGSLYFVPTGIPEEVEVEHYQRIASIQEQELGPEHPELAATLNRLAAVYENHDRFALAESTYQRAREIREASLGPDHPLVADSLTGLADVYRARGWNEEADPLFRQAVEIYEQAYGPYHPCLAAALNSWASKPGATARYEASPLLERAIEAYERSLGPDHHCLILTLEGYANNLRLLGWTAKAKEVSARAQKIRASWPRYYQCLCR